MLPEEKARVKIDKQLTDSGWNIVSRDEYIPNLSLAVKEALMQGGKESDYLLFIDNKAIAVIEAKKEENFLGILIQKVYAKSIGLKKWDLTARSWLTIINLLWCKFIYCQ